MIELLFLLVCECGFEGNEKNSVFYVIVADEFYVEVYRKWTVVSWEREQHYLVY